MGHVGLSGPRINRHAPVFKFAARTSAKPFRHQLQGSIECGPAQAARKHDLRLRCPPLHAGFETDAGQPEVGIDRPQPYRHRRTRRHAGR